MARHSMYRRLLSGSLMVVFLCCCLAAAGHQEQPAASENPPQDETLRVQFNFQDASYDDVLNYFSRVTGLPIVREVEAPDGSVTYLSPKSFTLEEGLRTLNILLQTQGVMLRIEEDMLYLQKLDDMKREDIPTYVGTVPGEVTGDKIVTVVRQLINAPATSVAEQLKEMIGTYGSITAMPQANQLVIVETAAQIRRLEEIIAELDREDVENTIEYILVEHVKASNMLETVKSLIGQRVVEYIIDHKGKKKKIEEEKITGLSITADDRTGAIIARGSQAKLEKLKEAVALLDVPATGGGRDMQTFIPQTLTPAEAATKLEQLYKKLPEEQRPTILTFDDFNKVTVIGSDEALHEGQTLLREIDGGPGLETTTRARTIATVALDHAEPQDAIETIEALLNSRQSWSTKLVAGPDGESVVIAGPQADVDATRSILKSIDRPAAIEPQVRMVRLSGENPQQTLDRARALFQKQIDVDNPQHDIDISLDSKSATATLVGSERALNLFSESLQMIQESALREVRVTELEHAEANEIAASLSSLVAETLAPGGTPPTIQPIARTNGLLIAATPQQHRTIKSLIETLDAPAQRVSSVLRLFRLKHATTQSIGPTVREVLTDRLRHELPQVGGDLSAQITITEDVKTNTLIVSAPEALMPLAEELINQLDDETVSLNQSTMRVVPLEVADAGEVSQALSQAISRMQSEATGERMDVKLIASPGANSLIMVGPEADLNQVEQLIEPLDAGGGGDQPQVRTVFLKNARAARVAPIVEQLLREEQVFDPNELPSWQRMNYLQMIQRQDSDKAKIRAVADERLNAVVLSGPTEQLAVAEEMVEQLDVEPGEDTSDGERSVHVLTIQNADANELAQTLEALLAEETLEEQPPTIRVNNASNSLLVRASDRQFETIARVVDEVDQATIATSRQMRTIRIDPARADVSEMARMLDRVLHRRQGSSVEVITVEELLQRRHQKPEEPKTDEPPADSTSFVPRQVPSGHMGMLFTAVIGFVQNDSQPTSSDAELTIAVDKASNSLILFGSPRGIDRVRDLIQQMQDQLPTQPTTVHYIGLPEGADARRITNMVNQTLRRVSVAGGRRGDIQRRSAVIADQANNAIVVAANEADFETIGDLVAAMSTSPAVDEVMVKVYPLANITAERAASSVEALIEGNQPRRRRNVQQMRDLAITLLAEGETIEAVFDPDRVRVSADMQTNSLIVMGPAEAIDFTDRFVGLIDQSPVNVQATLKLFPLEHAEAGEVRRSLRGIFRARFRNMRRRQGRSAIEPEFSVDDRTNTLLVTASPEQLQEIEQLLGELDQPLGEDRHPLRVIELSFAQPDRAADILENVVIGADQDRRNSTKIVANDASGVLLVRAGDEVMAEIDEVLAEIDREATSAFPVRTITLERADAGRVADSLQTFYDDRAKIASAGRGRRTAKRRVSIVGDSNTSMLLVAASDENFKKIQQLVERFDSPQASESLDFRIVELDHAKATEIEETVQSLVNDLTWNQGPIFFSRRFGGSNQQSQDKLAVRADARLNALILTGQGDRFEVAEKIITALDAPVPTGDQRTVKLYPVQNAKLSLVEQVIRDTYSSAQQQRWWEPEDPTEVKVSSDTQTNTLIVFATGDEHEEISGMIDSLSEQVATTDQTMQVLPIEFANANELARTIERFLRDRARAMNQPSPTATVIASGSTNSLLVSASRDDLATIRDLLSRIDKPDVGGDRNFEIVVLEEGDAAEISQLVGDQFPDSGGRGVRITPDVRTNSLILNAPPQQIAQAKALINQLDAPEASDVTIIRTYGLDSARASEAVDILGDTLKLDASGRTEGISIKLEASDAPAVEVTATIVADRRSNSLIVTATEESFPVIESLINRIDTAPASSPLQWRIVPLEHALAADVYYTLTDFFRGRRGSTDPEPRIDYNRARNELIIGATDDQFEQMTELLAKIDVQSDTKRITEFVPLKFAEAEKIQEALSYFYGPYAMAAETPGQESASIVADPASNSLVISANEEEWDNIRALLNKLDSEEYDASLQLRVMPLLYADAQSVARAINEAFQAGVQTPGRGRGAQRQPQDQSGGENRREQPPPTVLVESEEWVRAAAEPQTNSVIVSASRANIAKIEKIVEQLDVADYAKLPPPRIIPVTTGSPDQLAESIRQLYTRQNQNRGRKSLRIVGDPTSNSVIVRAEEDEFRQIATLADALQQEASAQGLSVHVLQLEAAPANRVASAVTEAYAAKAKKQNQPLSIQVDPIANALIIASTMATFEEIEETIQQLDRIAPAAGQGIFIIELENISPQQAKETIEKIGLTQPQSPDSFSRLVTEPVKVSVLQGRRSVVVVANPADRETVVGLLKAIDAEPELAEATVRVVSLKNAQASAVADVIRKILNPSQQDAQTDLAEAVQEQIRRLSVQRDGVDDDDLALDLTEPIRIFPDESLNALVISSTEKNIAALQDLISLFDQLPMTDAVTVQLFPLENIAADQFVRIINDLFRQGKQLAGVPGTDLQGMPGGMVGRALLDEIALSVDDRTNTVIVAGKEDAVALVEVLRSRIDSEIATGWVEPRIIPLNHADAEELAETLEAIVVEGADNLPQSAPLQRQVGRLRIALDESKPGQVIEADVYQPMTRLLIRPEPQLNALIVVGTPINLEVITELVSMLDVEAASPSAAVRIYPVEHASAAQLAGTITELFDQQVDSKAIRPEDRVIVQADERTNSLIVTTSPRSFAVLESLLDTLDSEVAPDLRSIRRIKLTHASATRLASLIQNLMDARLERLRQIQPETADLERATIIADARTNSLVIAAGNQSFDVIKRLAKDLDSPTLGDDSLMQVISVSSGNLDRLAETIQSIMDRRYADMPDELQESQKPLVLTDARSSSLLVAANPEDLTAIENLVAQLEAVPIDPAVGVHVISVDGSNADDLANKLDRLMRDRLETLGDARTPTDQVAIEADIASNSLIVSASEENLTIIRDLMDVLTSAGTESVAGRDVEVITLTAGAQAENVVELLDDMYVEEENRRRGQGTVQVSADNRLNAVLVNAPPADVEAIRGLVDQLDGAKPAQVVEVKTIPLNSANSIEMVELIRTVLSGRNVAGPRASQQATVLKYAHRLVGDETGREMSEMEVSTAIRESINLTPDIRTNSIVVTAPAESMELISQMINDLDNATTGAKKLRIFKLENSDAEAMARIITDLFNLRQQDTINVLKPRETPGDEEVDFNSATGFLETELTTVPDERQQLSITVDSRTNTLLVSATPKYLDLVDEIVAELDSLEANERETMIYPLKNASADDVATVINEFVREDQEKLLATIGPDQLGSAARLLEREVTIVGDEKSNTLLVTTSPRYMEQVRTIINELDIDPPQVLIQVLLAEITLDSAKDYGASINASGEVADADVSAGFGLTTAALSAMGVPNVAVAATDFNLLLEALHAQGRLQVLSNPSIMVANNEEANIQVGQKVRLPESTSIDFGTQQSSVEEEDLGVILTVTPSINPEGFVRMDIQPEISNLTSQTIQINEDFETPVITIRTADTTVTVQDGQTVVLGGLISDRYEIRQQRVPVLGDIPVVGWFFRSSSEQIEKTELLIVLTPHVVLSPAEMNTITEDEVDRLSLPPRLKEQIREGSIIGSGGLFDSQGNLIEVVEPSTNVGRGGDPEPRKELLEQQQ